jgi:hypothetical protein
MVYLTRWRARRCSWCGIGDQSKIPKALDFCGKPGPKVGLLGISQRLGKFDSSVARRHS